MISPARSLLALLVLSGLVAGCKHGTTMGRGCSATTACPVDYACVIGFDGATSCMAGCTINETVCTDHSACLALRPGPTHVCYVGGGVPLGETCTSLIDCEHTGICVEGSTPGTGTCLVGCNLDGTVGCDGGGTCTATADGNRGYCVP